AEVLDGGRELHPRARPEPRLLELPDERDEAVDGIELIISGEVDRDQIRDSDDVVEDGLERVLALLLRAPRDGVSVLVAVEGDLRAPEAERDPALDEVTGQEVAVGDEAEGELDALQAPGELPDDLLDALGLEQGLAADELDRNLAGADLAGTLGQPGRSVAGGLGRHHVAVEDVALDAVGAIEVASEGRREDDVHPGRRPPGGVMVTPGPLFQCPAFGKDSNGFVEKLGIDELSLGRIELRPRVRLFQDSERLCVEGDESAGERVVDEGAARLRILRDEDIKGGQLHDKIPLHRPRHAGALKIFLELPILVRRTGAGRKRHTGYGSSQKSGISRFSVGERDRLRN